ncbi:MAG: NosD domain-containing protein, partial [Phycisphaerae bacterium]
MAAIIKRAGKVIISILLPFILLSILVYSAYLLQQAKAEQPNLSVAREELLKQKPVWTEDISQRNSNGRVWEVTKWQEEIRSAVDKSAKSIAEDSNDDPAMSKSEISTEIEEPNIVQVKSYVREKGCGICYKDENANWQITDTSWKQTPTGFVMDKANYALEMGGTADSLLYYDIGGETLSLKADSIKIYDGQGTLPFASVNAVNGYIDPNDKSRLIYPNAFGSGIDLEIQAQPDGFHQNVVFKSKLNLPANLQKEKAKVFLYTQLGLDEYLNNSQSKGCPVKLSSRQKNINVTGFDVSKFSKSNIDFIIEKNGFDSFTSHSFADSEILQHNEKGELENLAVADKQIIRDSDNKTYLVESLDCSEIDEAAYPVVWDYHNVSGTMTQNEVWYADATYYVSSSITLGSGVELKIEPGAIVKFRRNPNSSCISAFNGTFIAKGEPYSYIVFTSARDPNMGEVIDTNAVSISDWTALYVNTGSSIEFCKVGYSNYGIVVDASHSGEAAIKNNIVFNSNYQGISVYATNTQGQGNITIFNNLIYSVYCGIYADYDPMFVSDVNIIITNNTVKTTTNSPYGLGILVYNYGNQPAIIKNNIIQGSQIGIGNFGLITEQNNAFYQCTNLLGSGEANSTDVNLTASPFDLSMTCLGSYFLNNDPCGGARLINAGDANVADYYDEPNDWSISAVFDANHFFNTYPTIGIDTTWQPNYNACDSGTVAIGYHHPRVDYLLGSNVTVSSGKTLTIKPGTVVAMGYGLPYDTYRSLYVYGKLIAEGSPFDGGYINFIQSSLATTNWNVVKYAQLANPYIYLYSTSDANSSISFSKIFNLMTGLMTDKALLNPVHDNVFKFNYYGILFSASGSNFGIKNNLFINNYYGISKSGAYTFLVYNNTFDRNVYCGLYCSSNYGDVKNCIFADSNSTTSAYGIYMSSTFYSLTEAYNAFYNNTKHYMKASTEQALASTDFAGVPSKTNAAAIDGNDFYQAWDYFGDRFYLPQDSNLVDSGNVSDVNMWGYTTDPNAVNDPNILWQDDNRRDIGYHYPMPIDTDDDGLYDYEEYWLGTDPNDSDSDNDCLSDYAE